ncbi:pyrimidine/purine nucleoside phosphorylase [Thiocapsa roseopersicina]|uniref:Pyrimidine/purine nucleoside phosphorylase n=1 Tax=Thiocapsa roseopersicina TaxID=1058 RepID=A0A1H2T0C7_THIRO|nr:pyrimidine/purine nucleoside phosphorylase [Thiocapsa roseopersicina]SDW37403.1 hypothetical protein SAMN05421783_103236 [Thiocapsa roseopersicina]
MSEFTNVSIVKKANCYFGGGVTSRTIRFPDGSKKTLGIMQPGDYEFTTLDREIMEILEGDLDVLLPDATDWVQVQAGESFEVPAQATFSIRVRTLTDYCCSFVS